jgi:hypothetical protein
MLLFALVNGYHEFPQQIFLEFISIWKSTNELSDDNSTAFDDRLFYIGYIAIELAWHDSDF